MKTFADWFNVILFCLLIAFIGSSLVRLALHFWPSV